jgi:hypothetical protein
VDVIVSFYALWNTGLEKRTAKDECNQYHQAVDSSSQNWPIRACFS